MDQGEHDVSGHVADDMRLVRDLGGTAVGGHPSLLAVAPGARLAVMKAWMLAAE
jgi:hypothetical protein